MIQRRQNFRNQRFDIFHPITLRHDYENGDRQSGQILLKLDVLIRGEKHVEVGGRKHQQLPVLYSRPSTPWDGRSFVSDQA